MSRFFNAKNPVNSGGLYFKKYKIDKVPYEN